MADMAPDQGHLRSLLALCPDPEECQPGAFNFKNHMEGAPEDRKPGAGPQRLPQRLLLSAFSRNYGHRPTGMQVAQAQLLAKRFVTDFREMSMERTVLPCCMDGLRPFIAADGLLPCPSLSTFNALKYLQEHPRELAEAEPRARAQIEKIFKTGVQVDWIECQSFLQWQLQVEAAAVQGTVYVAPHVVDTALKYLRFCHRTDAQGGDPASSQGQGTGDKTLDEAFVKLLPGRAHSRLLSAKTMLGSTEPAVIVELARWRKYSHFLHANALAQHYFVSTEQWAALRGQSVVLERTAHSLQLLVAKQLMKGIQDVEIVDDTDETPRLRHSATNKHLFRQLCATVLYAANFKVHLRAQHMGVWDQVPSAEKLFKRLMVSGEPALQEVFRRGVAVADGRIERLNFPETDPSSDWAEVCARLQKATNALKQRHQQGEREPAAVEADAAAAAAAAGAVGDLAPSHASPGVAPAPAPSQDHGQQHETEQTPVVAASYEAALRGSRISTKDVFQIYDRPWQKGDPVPPGLADVPPGTIFVAPSPSTSRGHSSKGVRALTGPGVGVLEFFTDECAAIVGLGHEPEHKAVVRSKMEQINKCFKKAKWEIIPVLQQQRTFNYTEYFLVGCGAKYPETSRNKIPKWLGPGPLAVESAARIVSCEKERSGTAIARERAEHGHVALCRTCRDIQNRVVIPMPRSREAGGPKVNKLLGGDEAKAKVAAAATGDGDDVSSVSSDAGSEAEEAQAEGGATAQLEGKTASAKIRPARQGMAASLWSLVLNAMQPSKVVLAGTVTFQAGFLLAMLQYNESVYGLGAAACPLVGFCAQEPPTPTQALWTNKHVKQWQARHLCLHSVERSLFAYAARRCTAVAANQRAAVSGIGRGRVLQREGTDASQGGVVEAPEPPQAKATKFIMAHANYGKDKKLLPKPLQGDAEPDSDDPDADAPSHVLEREVMGKRNDRFLSKHEVMISASSEISGMGLFAACDFKTGRELPAKGPWFNSLEAVDAFLATLHTDTAAMFSQRVVRLDLAPEAAKEPAAASQGQKSLYKIITSPVGFINHYTALQSTPNCQLVLKECMPLG